jgi:hypothetical protein
LLGATFGSDIVKGFGTFAGAFTQNSANTSSEETITIDCGAVITSPGSQDYVGSPVTDTFKGADGKSYTLSTSHQAILAFGPGTLSNAGVIAFASESLEDNAALFAYDSGPAGETPSPPNGNQAQYWGNAVFAHAAQVASSAGIAITNGAASNSAAAVTSTVGGRSTANVAGIFIGSWNGDRAASNFTLDNYGTISGTYNGSASATAAGVYAKTDNGGQNIQNRAGGSISASAPYYANAIYANTFFGNVRIVSDGSLTTTATGSLMGNTEGQGAAIGIDVFTYSGDISVTTGGALEVTSAGTAKSTAVGLSLWASTGTVAYTNSGYIKATASGASTTANGLCAGNIGGPLTLENTGTIEADAPGGGWAAGLQQDSAHPIAISNQGTLSHKTGYGLFLFGTEGGKATVVNEASGTISGGNEAIAAEGYAGDLTIHVYGLVSAGDPQQTAMNLGPGNDTVELNGSPTVIGTMNGGKGNNSLVLKLTGALETVNGTVATQGNELSAYNLGSSGNITVSCRTYTWVNFQVSGTITK